MCYIRSTQRDGRGQGLAVVVCQAVGCPKNHLRFLLGVGERLDKRRVRQPERRCCESLFLNPVIKNRLSEQGAYGAM